MLLNNGYPLKLFFETMRKGLLKLIKREIRSDIAVNHISSNNDVNPNLSKFFVIPYMHKISEGLFFNFKDFNIRASYVGLNKLITWLISSG